MATGSEAAKIFLRKALANVDNRTPHVFSRDGLRSYAAAIRELKAEGVIRPMCRQITRRYSNNPVESDHRHVKQRLIRKGQVLGITRRNLHGQAWVFGAVLGAV